MTSDPQSRESAEVLAVASELHMLVGRLKRRLREEASAGDFTPSQVSVLLHLERQGPTTVTGLANALGMRPQSMGANVSALEATGLIRGEADPNDGRQTIWSLTADARAGFQANRAARENWLFQSIRMKLTPEEQKALATGVGLLRRLLES
jgi:transcriptional regulator, MarR family